MFNSGSSSLKYYKRLKIFKNSTGTVSFNPQTMEAWSYNWKFVSMVNGKVVFNDYNWSPTTSCHQSAVSAALRLRNIDYIRVDAGSTRPEDFTQKTVQDLYKSYCEDFVESEYMDVKVKRDTWAKKSRHWNLKYKLENISKLEALKSDFKLTKKFKIEAMRQAEEKFLESINTKEEAKCFKFLSLQAAAQDVNEIKF